MMRGKFWSVDGSKLCDVFFHGGRLCVVVERTMESGTSFHNGYVQVCNRNAFKDYDGFAGRITTDELTYSGDILGTGVPQSPTSIWFFGFDSAHVWNDESPDSKTFMSVREKTKKLAEEMVRKRI